MPQLLLHGLLALLAALIDTSALSAWSAWPFLPQLVPCGVLYTAATQPTRTMYVWVGVGGGVVGLFTAFGFGLHLISWLLAGGLVATLARNVLTNRSVVSMLVLGLVGSATAIVASVLLSQLLHPLRLAGMQMSWSTLLPSELLPPVVANTVVLVAVTLLQRRGRPVLEG